MSYHEDINKMALDGRFCGRYSPGNLVFVHFLICFQSSYICYDYFEIGNLTIFSNRILIRFTANSFKMDAIAKKGFLAECSLVSPSIFLVHAYLKLIVQ
jgi:hypothetical protein